MTGSIDQIQHLLDKGVADNAAGRPDQAARSLREVVRLTEARDPAGGDPGDRARVRALMGLATAEFERSGPAEALVWMDRAVEAASALHDAELDTLCHSQRATLLGRSGDFGAALEELKVADRGLDTLAPRDRAVLLLNYGNVLMFTGDLDGAVERFGRSADIALAHSHHREAFMSRCNQGMTAYRLGDLPGALDLLHQAGAVAADVSVAVLGLLRGRVLLEAGLVPEALADLTAAAGRARGEPQRQTLGEIEIELARAHVLLRQFAEARTWARRARTRFRHRSSPRWAARADLVLGQLDLAVGHDPADVLARAQRLAEDLSGDTQLQAEQQLIAAEAALAVGDSHRAEQHLAAVSASSRLLPLRAQLQTARVQAELAVARGREDRARRVLDRAAGVLLREQEGAASTDLRAAVAMHATPLARLHLRLVRERGVRAVFECVERWRATGTRVQPVRPPEDEELARLLIRERGVREELLHEPTSPRRAALLVEEADLRHAVRARSWAWAGSRMSHRTVSYDDTRAALAEREADLLSLVPDRGRLLGVAVVNGRGRVVDLGPAAVVAELASRARADLDVAGRHDLGPFEASVWGSLRSAMSRLDGLLLQPVGVGGRRLVLVPHRDAVALPWALAPSLVGVPFVVASCATDWLARAALAGTRDGRPAVVRALAGPALALADEEVAGVAAGWGGGTTSPAARTTVADLCVAMAEADLVHLAAHGRHHPQSPMFASVRLVDGHAYVYDLQQQGAPARHVVLSACEVGQATIRPGDEPLGLSAGLLALGVQCVVAGVSRVPDDVSAATMTDYHAALAAGVPSDEAMARAVEKGSPLGAAFQVAGAPWSG